MIKYRIALIKTIFIKIIKKSLIIFFKKVIFEIKKKIELILNKFKIEYVFNFAAYSHVDNSIKSPKDFITHNVNDFISFLDVCNNYQYKFKKLKFIQISTDEVFGSLRNNHDYFTNKTPYNPSSPYSSSKASCDLILNSYIKTYEFPAVITYSCNNFGPNQFKEKFIPTVINSCKQKKKIPIYGTGKNKRQWIYVKDNIYSIIKIANQFLSGNSYCISSNYEATNVKLVKIICKIFKQNSLGFKYENLIKYVEDRKGHDHRYFMKSPKSLTTSYTEKDFENLLYKTIQSYY